MSEVLSAREQALLKAAKLADRRIADLCSTVCLLSGHPRKVRAEDYAAELRAAIAAYAPPR